MAFALSVITPVLDRDDRVVQTIASVGGQAATGFEHVVVGDVGAVAADLGTAAADRVHRVPSGSRDLLELVNLGLRAARGDYVGWLLPGDRHLSDTIGSVTAFLAAHPQVDVVYGETVGVHDDGETIHEFTGKTWSPRRLRRRNVFRQPATFARRASVLDAGGLDSRWRTWADYDLWLTILERGGSFAMLPRQLAAQWVTLEGEPAWAASDPRDATTGPDIQDVRAAHGLTVTAKTLAAYGVRRAWFTAPENTPPASVRAAALEHALEANARWNTPSLPGLRRLLVSRYLLQIPDRQLRPPAAGDRNATWTSHEAKPFQMFRRRFGRLVHHDPVPLRLPRSYAQATPPADPPTISIVTPSFNQAEYVEATIASVLDQGYPRLEYVVQDGGSRDASPEIIRRHAARLTRWESRPDKGQAHAINLGFVGTTGGIMAYLNSDDLLLPGSLAYVASYFAAHPEVDVVYGHRVLVDEQGREIGRWVLPAHDDEALAYFDFVPQETMFWRRRAWDAAGGSMDESFQFALDWDLILRFRTAGMRFVRLPRFLGAFRVTETQKTTRWLASVGQRESQQLRARVLGRLPTRREVQRHFDDYVRRHLVVDKLYLLGLLRY